jgi:hypothetical protein
MKTTEFLAEAGLVKTKLRREYLVNLAKAIEGGIPIDLVPDAHAKYGSSVVIKPKYAKLLRSVAKNAQANSANYLVLTNDLPDISRLETQDNEPLLLTSIEKSDILKGGGKGYNVGDIGEIALGIAASIKFLKHGEEVTRKDFLSLALRLKFGSRLTKKGKVGGAMELTYTGRIKHKNGKEDDMSLIIVANGPSAKKFREFIQNPETFPADVAASIESALLYVKENGNIKNGIEYTANDPNTNIIEITCDGISDQKGTKADLVMNIDGRRINLLSAKTGKSQLGQASGHQWTNQQIFFKTVFGVNIAPFAKLWGKTNDEHIAALQRIWSELVIPKCAGLAAGDNTSKERILVKTIAGGLIRYSNNIGAGGEVEVVDIVKLATDPSKPGYKLLRIDSKLTDALDKVNIIVTWPESRMGVNVYGLVPNTLKNGTVTQKKVSLCRFWSTVGGNILRTAVQGGDLLDELAAVAKEADVPTTAKPPATKPVPLAPKKVAPAPQIQQPNADTQPDSDAGLEIPVPTATPRARRTATQPVRARR